MDVLDPTCVYTFICVEIKTNTETVASRVFQKGQTTLVRKVQFFLFLSWRRVLRGAGDPIFFLPILHFLSSLLPTLCVYGRSYWSKSSDLTQMPFINKLLT